MANQISDEATGKTKTNKIGSPAWVGLGIGLGLTVVLTTIYFYEHGPKAVQESEQIALAPKPAPGFALPDSSGRTFRLEDFKGSAVLLHFWASWCPPCIDEIPLFMELGRKFPGRPVKFIAISLDTKWSDAHKILPEKNLPANFLSLLDESAKLPDDYGTYQFPETYLLNTDLQLVTKWVGPQDWGSAPIRGAIEKAMGGATAPAKSTEKR